MDLKRATPLRLFIFTRDNSGPHIEKGKGKEL